MAFRRVVLDLGEPDEVELVFRWFERHPFTGLDPSLVDRCALSMAIDQRRSGGDYATEEDWATIEANAQAVRNDLLLLGQAGSPRGPRRSTGCHCSTRSSTWPPTCSPWSTGSSDPPGRTRSLAPSSPTQPTHSPRSSPSSGRRPATRPPRTLRGCTLVAEGVHDDREQIQVVVGDGGAGTHDVEPDVVGEAERQAPHHDGDASASLSRQMSVTTLTAGKTVQPVDSDAGPSS